MYKIYGKRDCSRCDQVKNILNKRNIDYEYFDISTEDKYIIKLIREKNNNLYPLIMNNDEVVSLSYVLNKV